MTNILFQLIIFFIIFHSTISHRIDGPEFCDQIDECLAKIRKMAQESNRFWFGDSWRFNCGNGGQQQNGGGGQRARQRNRVQGNPLDCLNPPELAPFASLGSRLFRVHTFTPAYLANLRIFPRIHFQPRTGFYHACSHNFEVNVTEEERLFGLAGHPLAQPIPGFQAQYPPDLNWPELHANQSHIVLMMDVGWGRLAYLAIDFPRDTKVLAHFQPIDNFRPKQPTPLAVLIFESPSLMERKSILEAMEMKWMGAQGKMREHFELSKFMLENRLERGLIGLNWALIEADPFSIEKQRIQGMPDNCHSLILQKLITDQRWHFVQTFPLSIELDSSLSVSVAQPHASFQTCCHSQNVQAEQIFLDPLADLQIPTIAFRQRPPTVTSMRQMESAGEPAYQRASRHYIVYNDERFTLALFDPDHRYLHWLLVDISAEALAAGNFQEASTVADYLVPIPTKPGQCLFAIFMLFRQPKSDDSPLAEFFDRDHPLRHSQCQSRHCPHRADFNIEQFKALHRLHLSAINWAKICFDLFEASHQISLLRKKPELMEGIDRTAKILDGKRSKKGTHGGKIWDRAERERQIAEICSHFPVNSTATNGEGDDQRECLDLSNSSSINILWIGWIYTAIFLGILFTSMNGIVIFIN